MGTMTTTVLAAAATPLLIALSVAGYKAYQWWTDEL
jgi:hypothetical protein